MLSRGLKVDVPKREAGALVMLVCARCRASCKHSQHETDNQKKSH